MNLAAGIHGIEHGAAVTVLDVSPAMAPYGERASRQSRLDPGSDLAEPFTLMRMPAWTL